MIIPILMGLTHKKTFVPTIHMLKSAIRWFFFPQFQTVLFPKIRPVVNVDHPLDVRIPFIPALVAKYLQFVQLWMSSIFLLERRYGKRAFPLLGAYITTIANLYEESGRVYSRVQSTTSRPKKKANLRFALIHTFDPHLHCVPSLHILIVLVNWMLSGEVVRELGNPESGWEQDFMKWTWDEALRIVETILFVKQHSLNCVGASYYFLNIRNPGIFDDEAIKRINDALFTYEGGEFVTEENKNQLREIMMEIYEDLKIKASVSKTAWDDVLVSFMNRLNEPG